MQALVSFIIVTYQRNDEAIAAVNSVLAQSGEFEIIIIDNNPDSTLEENLPVDTRINHYLQDENRGYVWARNYAVSVSQGDILFYLDDDAELEGRGVIEFVRTQFDNVSEIACLAFQIRNYYTNKIVPMEFPHPDVSLKNKSMLVSYYVGAGHAFRRSVLFELGPFLDMGYGAEELEYSYRLVNRGYVIKYVPEIAVLHKASPKGRHSRGRNVYYSIRNRFWALSRHLPWRFLIVNLSLWSVVWFIRSFRSNTLGYFVSGLRDGLKKMQETVESSERHALTSKALRYLRHNGGRLWF